MKIVLLSALLVVSPALADAETPPDTAKSGAPQDRPIVATVNGEPIFFEDVERQLDQLHSGLEQTTRDAFDVDQLMFRLINDTLLAQEARALGMQDEEPIPSRLEEMSHDLAVRQLEREEILEASRPTEEEMRAAFEQEYRTATLRIITCPEPEQAREALAELEAGAEFEALAAERSIDDYSQRGGLIRDLSQIDMPAEIAEVAFTTEPGRLVGPIRTGLGWAIVRTESVAPADPERFEGLRKRLRDLVQLRKAEALRSELGTRLREIHEIAVDEEATAAVAPERLPDGRLMPEIEDPEAVVARVGARAITAEELGRALGKRWRGVRNEEAAAAATPLVLDRLIRDELMLAEALRRGYDDTPVVRRARAAFEKQLLVPRFLSEIVLAGIEVSDEEARSFYDENRELFRRPPRVHVGQITVEESERATEMAELLRQGTDLAWLARQHSIDGFAESGGDRGWIVPRRRLSALQDALLDAEAGDILGPMGVPGRYTVVRVNAVEEQGDFSFAEAAGNARSGALELEYREAIDGFLKKLRSRSEITIDEDVLASMTIIGQQTSEDATPPGQGL